MAPASEIERLRGHPEHKRLSARNHLRGTVRDVQVERLLSRVEIEVRAPAHVVAVITRESAEELGLAPGVEAAAVVKATSVMVER